MFGNGCMILRRKQVEAKTGMSRSAIYAGISQETFPKPIKLSARSVGWTLEAVENWINSRIALSRGGLCH